ncbi:hypothetical protein [Fulvivirga sedimenti]|uniref:Uncharacterized protein n=1 Tax=Fulvivirga sedimenti TaxID=2879465 RepID=A0A9X1L0R0_9BACT|nr:hypothetical protein [Fulvivirga sedimenti]MCA6074949.1 hypothetical protein [Fulvivirga sedimenti]MCA6076126.1 hypothetical protein [Fulvivirga sedimenti]MCA6077254.1 hypothetical protein [Fulvivirga sedimenti]
MTTVGLFYRANPGLRTTILLILVWSVLQCVLAILGFYGDLKRMPPPLLAILLPPFILIIYGSTGKRLRRIESQHNIVRSTWVHSVRLPVEIVLFYLYSYEMVPQLMTFAGRNFDIIAGISAPFVALLYFRDRISDLGLFLWNVVCLGLVLFILVNGVLSTEVPFQQFAFEQPNKAVTLFPYVLLPATVVPLVIFSHVIDLLILGRKINRND